VAVLFYIIEVKFIKEVILRKKALINYQYKIWTDNIKDMIHWLIRWGRLKINLICLMIILGLTSFTGFSQGFQSIHIEEIPQRKVRKYIVSREIDKMHDFSAIHSSWKKEIRESDFNVNEKIFYLSYNLSNVWKCYSHANPVETWNGKSMSLGLLISKESNSAIYTKSSAFPEIDTGQVYFLNLRLIKGLFNVPVAFEIINIDRNHQIEEISYIDNNKSLGKQTIQFFDNGDGRTRIVHRSYFKSESWLRDKLLYPYFHRKFIKEFHGNMRLLIRNANLPASVLN
jgi:hypothetical protein